MTDTKHSAERAEFEAFAKRKGWIQESHGIRSVSSICDAAFEAWQARAAIAAAAPAGEPVAWMSLSGKEVTTAASKRQMETCGYGVWGEIATRYVTPLYAAPVPAAAPKAALTDEQIEELASKYISWSGTTLDELIAFTHSIEAASGPNAALVEALRKISHNQVETFDEHLGQMVLVSMGEEELSGIAYAALAAAGVKP